MGHSHELSQARECLVCDGPCKEPMRFTRVIGRDRIHDVNEHEDDAGADAAGIAPIGKRTHR